MMPGRMVLCYVYFMQGESFLMLKSSLCVSSIFFTRIVFILLLLFRGFRHLGRFLLLGFCDYRVHFSPFCSSILEPNFDLTFRHSQCVGELCSLGSSQIFCLLKCFLQQIYLTTAERGPRVSSSE